MFDGQVFDTEVEMRHQCQADVWRFVREWLMERGFTLREAVFDTPKDLTHFEGEATFLAWDKEAKRYYRTDQPLPPQTSVHPRGDASEGEREDAAPCD
jgi:hypothetical protein